MVCFKGGFTRILTLSRPFNCWQTSHTVWHVRHPHWRHVMSLVCFCLIDGKFRFLCISQQLSARLHCIIHCQVLITTRKSLTPINNNEDNTKIVSYCCFAVARTFFMPALELIIEGFNLIKKCFQHYKNWSPVENPFSYILYSEMTEININSNQERSY